MQRTRGMKRDARFSNVDRTVGIPTAGRAAKHFIEYCGELHDGSPTVGWYPLVEYLKKAFFHQHMIEENPHDRALDSASSHRLGRNAVD